MTMFTTTTVKLTNSTFGQHTCKCHLGRVRLPYNERDIVWDEHVRNRQTQNLFKQDYIRNLLLTDLGHINTL